MLKVQAWHFDFFCAFWWTMKISCQDWVLEEKLSVGVSLVSWYRRMKMKFKIFKTVTMNCFWLNINVTRIRKELKGSFLRRDLKNISRIGYVFMFYQSLFSLTFTFIEWDSFWDYVNFLELFWNLSKKKDYRNFEVLYESFGLFFQRMRN